MSLYFYPSLFPMLNVSCSLVLNAYSDISDGVSAFMSRSCWNKVTNWMASTMEICFSPSYKSKTKVAQSWILHRVAS